jgi:hypothetical protein
MRFTVFVLGALEASKMIRYGQEKTRFPQNEFGHERAERADFPGAGSEVCPAIQLSHVPTPYAVSNAANAVIASGGRERVLGVPTG